MKKMLLALPLLAAVPLLFAQDRPKKEVESTLKRVLDQPKTVVELPIKELVAAPEPEKFDLSKTGIPWRKGLDAALNQGRPILLFQLLGNFDDVYC